METENPQNQPQPKANFKKYFLMLLLLVGVAAIAGFGAWYYFSIYNNAGSTVSDSTAPTPAQSATPSGFEKLDGTAQLNNLKDQTSSQTPAAGQKQETALSKLPADIQDLLTGALNLQVWSTTFATGTGFEAEFKLSENNVEAFRSVTKSLNRKIWTVKSGVYSDKAALLSLDSKVYTADVEFVQAEQGVSNVRMTIEIK